MSGFSELTGIRVRPLTSHLPAPTYNGWRASPFRAAWTETVSLLLDEIRHLCPREVILEADFKEAQLRQDGMPRASAIPASPGVILTLVGTAHGDLRYPCSTFRGWQENVRAIALSLEKLRAVDRYRVTRHGEQYAGWKALPPPPGRTSAARGHDLIRAHGGVPAALKATHPDHGGDPDDFAAVQAARKTGA